MDYSQINNDGDHPPGSSPWNSSPRQPAHASFSGDPPSPGQKRSDEGRSEEESSDQETLADQARRPSQTPTENGASSEEHADAQSNEQTPRAQQPPVYGQPQQHQSPQGIRQGRPNAPSRYQSGLRAAQNRNVPQYKLQAKVTALERTGKKDIIVRFDVHTNLPKFRTTQFRDVRRTHGEFKKLADHLISSNPEAFVPAVPPAVTSAGAGTDEDEARVKASLQRWLSAVCGNDVLMRDDEMRFFVESDFGYSPVVRMKQPATGVRRKYIKQFAPPPDDTPELQEARPTVKLFYLGAMDTGQKVDKLVKARRALGLSENDMGVRLTQMHVQETHAGLSTAYRKLGRTIQTMGDYHAAQGTAEAATLADPLNYHSDDAFIVKETLTNRHILLRELLQAQTATRGKLNAADRLKASSSVRREKVDEAISALDEAKSHEQYLGQKAQRVTHNLLLEKRKWFARTAADVRTAVREFVLREIEAERRTLALLENVRPDIRSIDATGGLSRLGREAHPAVRRASMQSSQGPKGDAWSGVQRRNEGLARSLSGIESLKETGEEEPEGEDGGRRAVPGGATGAAKSSAEDDEDRVDARNAASRLAASTF